MTEEKIKLKLTKFQWNNLQKLHDYLVKNKKKVEPHFDMSVFLSCGDGWNLCLSDAKSIKNCGTVGCLIGHGVIAGIHRYSKDTNWFSYTDRVFGTTDYNSGDDPLFTWLFAADWVGYQPTLSQAIKRLSYILKHRAVPKYHELTRLFERKIP